MYGFRLDRILWKNSVVNKPAPSSRNLKSMERVYPFHNNDGLYGVEVTCSGLPHFMTWQKDNVIRKGSVSIDDTIRKVGPYVANMTDEEQAMFLPVFHQFVLLHNVQHIQTYPDAVELAILVAGEPMLLVVQVVNMIEIDWSNRNYPDMGNRFSIN